MRLRTFKRASLISRSTRAPEKSLDPLHPEPPYGALHRTAELLAELLSGSEVLDVTALSEAVKAKLGIFEPLPKQALLSPSPGLSTLADDLKRSRVSRLLPKVTCPSPATRKMSLKLSAGLDAMLSGARVLLVVSVLILSPLYL